MHRAGVGGAGQRRVGFGIGWRKIFVGDGEEALKAASRTEVVVVAIVPCVVLAGRRIDLHAADRIGDRAVASGRPRRRRAAGCAARMRALPVRGPTGAAVRLARLVVVLVLMVASVHADSSDRAARIGQRANAPWPGQDLTSVCRPSRMRVSSASLCSTSRSEEHTSELQSLMRISYAVFCLKKKKKRK